MPTIRPVTDLRNNFADISRLVHESLAPVFLTKNGYGDMVVMSVETYESLVSELRIAEKLRLSALEAAQTSTRYDFDEVAARTRKTLLEKV